jgi:TRAP-type C4-dicarboxylate transport system permease small subunit
MPKQGNKLFTLEKMAVLFSSRMLSKIYKVIVSVFNEISAICLFAAMCLVGADVAMRYFLNAPIPGTLEITELAPVIITYGVLAFAGIQKRHIRTTFVIQRAPTSIKVVMEAFSILLMLSFLSLLIWRTTVEAHWSWAIKEYSQGIIAVPQYPVKIFIPFALFTAWLHFLVELVLLFKKRED